MTSKTTSSSKLLAVVMALLVSRLTAIYPDELWERSSKLTTKESFDAAIEDAIESDRTLFVRWIASEGWGWWKKQSPSWNLVTKAFKGNKDVAFGDVCLRDAVDIPREPHKPGAGGWFVTIMCIYVEFLAHANV